MGKVDKVGNLLRGKGSSLEGGGPQRMPSNHEPLAMEFHQELYSTYIEAKEKCGYNATRFLQMLGEHDGVETARRLLATGSAMQTGLEELWLCGRLDISVEAKVLLPKYRPLFSDEIRDTARKRLLDHKFDVDSWLRKFR
jgi:hypothetical protein